MLARTHLAFGLVGGLLISSLVTVEDKLVFFLLVGLGSILPDIDHERSTINRLLPITRWVPWVFKHRGFFHSVFPAAGLYVGLAYGGYPTEGLYLAIGYLLHLVSDALTKLGVNFLHPIARLHVRGFIEVGTFQETLVFGVLIVIILIKAFL